MGIDRVQYQCRYANKMITSQ